MHTETTNPLGEAKITSLLGKFAVPSIIAMLVSSLYNIVDQFFIGQKIGELGNAATNISFPLSISCIAIALLFGIGGASSFNIAMGRGQALPEERKKAPYFMGNSLLMMGILGTLLCVFTLIFLKPLLLFFGSPDKVLPYAIPYTRLIAFGFPFLIIATGGGHLIRADGRPRFTMICNLTGAVINTILDALFVFGFNWGMSGAALATVTGQAVSGGMAIYLLSRCQSVTLKKEHLVLHWCYVKRMISLGAAPCTNQLAMMAVQIVMTKSLKYYGALSSYGESIPIACVGIITKINQLYMAFIIGTSQGLQPIVSFNYGAGKYRRVKRAYLLASGWGFGLSALFFALFQLIPRQIISIFGEGSDTYYTFAVNYFRIFLFFTFLNFLQPISSNFFTAIGKPMGGIFLSLTRQIIFLLPLILLLPLGMGIDGIMYAGPVADCMAGLCSILMVGLELQRKQYRLHRK